MHMRLSALTILFLPTFIISLLVADSNAQAPAPAKGGPLLLGRTLAYRPLNEKNMKKGLNYQLFESTVTGYMQPDTTLRDSLVTVNDISVTKVPEGYVVNSTPRTVKHFVNDKLETDPIAQLTVGVSAKLHLNDQGIAFDLTGTSDIEKKIRSQFPPDSAAMLIKGINASSVKVRSMSEWNGRLGNLLNREIVLGEAKFDTGQVQLPNGHRLPTYIVSRIEDTMRIQGVWHLKVRITAATAPKDISSLSGLPLKEVIRGFKMADSTLRNYPLSKGAMTMKTDLLLEMNTLLMKSEEFTRTFYMEPELNDKQQPVFTRSVTYVRTLRYQY